MRDEEDGFAFRLHSLHDIHQLGNLRRCQHSRRLVENEYFVVAIEHFENFRSLLHAYGDILDKRVRIYIQPICLGEAQNLFSRLLFAKKAEFIRLHSEDDIIQHGKYLHKLEMLMYHADAERICVVRVADIDNLAVFQYFALFRLVKTEKNAHKSRFSRSVFAEQGMNLALFQLQGDIVVCDDARKYLCDIPHFNDIGSFARFILRYIYLFFIHKPVPSFNKYSFHSLLKM